MSFFGRCFTNAKLLNCLSIVQTNVRTKASRFPRIPKNKWPDEKKSWPGGQKYFGFQYYPRYPDQKDPEYTPTELFMVKRRRPYRKIPYWEKRILTDFDLDRRYSDIMIVKNSEDTNAKLWKIKHLITITPITFPDGYPSNENDVMNGRLYENGEYRIIPQLGTDKERLAATEQYQLNRGVLDRSVLRKICRRKWDLPYTGTVQF